MKVALDVAHRLRVPTEVEAAVLEAKMQSALQGAHNGRHTAWRKGTVASRFYSITSTAVARAEVGMRLHTSTSR